MQAQLTLIQIIKEDWIAHGRDRTRPGFKAIAVYRLGVWRMSIKSKLLRAPFSVIYKALFRRIRDQYGIELPYSATLGRRVIFEHQHGIVIHGSAVIGDDCIIRQGVTLGNRYMNRPLEAPILKENVNVGAGAKILGRVHIGSRVNIGANAVVIKDIPDNSTAVGNPAVLIKTKKKAENE